MYGVHRSLAVLLGAMGGLMAVTPSWAAGTTAGTTINNTASVQYSVGGVSQPSVTSNTASFLVDRRVNLTVAEVGGAVTTSSPGSSNQVTTFTVTNSTNSTQDFRLVASQDASSATTAFSHSDNFNVNNVRVFVDVNTNGVYDSATDTLTYLDELAADATRTVFVVVDIPSGQANGSYAGVTLTAFTATGGTASSLGADMTQTAGADTPGAVDTVFGDGGGDTDAARDGAFSDDDEYAISSATIALVKSARVVSDPFNSTTDPKAIPGAVIEYCIQVQNSGGTAATDIAISDTVPTNSTYQGGSIVVGGTVTTGVCNADGAAEDDDSIGADETDTYGGNYTGSVVSATLGSVAAGTTATARFRVSVN